MRASATRCRAFGLRPVPTPPSRPFGFNPSRLRAYGAARFACLQGIGARPIPAARAWRPSHTAEPAEPDRPGQRPAATGGAGASTPGLAAAGCVNACRPQRWRFLPITSEGRFTNITPGIAMELPRHAPRLAPQGVAGAFSPVVGVLTWPASGSEPVQPSCGDAEPALSPFDAARPKASLSRCESWRGRGCASGFMAATVQRKQFPLCCAHSSWAKFF